MRIWLTFRNRMIVNVWIMIWMVALAYYVQLQTTLPVFANITDILTAQMGLFIAITIVALFSISIALTVFVILLGRIFVPKSKSGRYWVYDENDPENSIGLAFLYRMTWKYFRTITIPLRYCIFVIITILCTSTIFATIDGDINSSLPMMIYYFSALPKLALLSNAMLLIVIYFNQFGSDIGNLKTTDDESKCYDMMRNHIGSNAITLKDMGDKLFASAPETVKVTEAQRVLKTSGVFPLTVRGKLFSWLYRWRHSNVAHNNLPVYAVKSVNEIHTILEMRKRAYADYLGDLIIENRFDPTHPDTTHIIAHTRNRFVKHFAGVIKVLTSMGLLIKYGFELAFPTLDIGSLLFQVLDVFVFLIEFF